MSRTTSSSLNTIEQSNLSQTTFSDLHSPICVSDDLHTPPTLYNTPSVVSTNSLYEEPPRTPEPTNFSPQEPPRTPEPTSFSPQEPPRIPQRAPSMYLHVELPSAPSLASSRTRFVEPTSVSWQSIYTNHVHDSEDNYAIDVPNEEFELESQSQYKRDSPTIICEIPGVDWYDESIKKK